MDEITTEQWQKAKAHFDLTLGEYEELKDTPGVNVNFAFAFVFLPLLKRWNNGERSQDLCEKMLAVE